MKTAYQSQAVQSFFQERRNRQPQPRPTAAELYAEGHVDGAYCRAEYGIDLADRYAAKMAERYQETMTPVDPRTQGKLAGLLGH